MYLGVPFLRQAPRGFFVDAHTVADFPGLGSESPKLRTLILSSGFSVAQKDS